MFWIFGIAEFRKSYIPQSKPHFSAASNASNHNDMPQATNVLLYDYSSQSETLGDACLIAVLSSITMMLCLVYIVVKKQ